MQHRKHIAQRVGVNKRETLLISAFYSAASRGKSLPRSRTLESCILFMRTPHTPLPTLCMCICMYASWYVRSRDISFSCAKGGKRKSEKKKKREEKRGNYSARTAQRTDRADPSHDGRIIVARSWHFPVYASSRAALSREGPIIGGFTISTFSR